MLCQGVLVTQCAEEHTPSTCPATESLVDKTNLKERVQTTPYMIAVVLTCCLMSPDCALARRPPELNPNKFSRKQAAVRCE